MICQRCPKCPIAVVLNDVDLSYWTSKVEHFVAFATIFSNTFTAHAQKRLFMNLHTAVKFLTLSFDSPPPISLQSVKFQRSGDVFVESLKFEDHTSIRS